MTSAEKTLFELPEAKSFGTESFEIPANADKTAITQEIDRPSHYKSKSGRDMIDWCEDFGIMSNAYVFNIFKYLARAGRKKDNSELQDALKARVYLDRYIVSLEKERETK